MASLTPSPFMDANGEPLAQGTSASWAYYTNLAGINTWFAV